MFGWRFMGGLGEFISRETERVEGRTDGARIEEVVLIYYSYPIF